MGSKALIRLIVLLVVVGAVAAILHFAGSGGGVSTVEPSTSKKQVFADFPINDVARIEIRDGEESVTLNKGEEQWEVAERGNYPAKASEVGTLLKTVWDLDIAQPVTIGRDHYGRLHLLDPSEESAGEEAATTVVFSDAEGGELASLWLGKVYEKAENRPNPFGGGMATAEAGRYVKRGDSHSVYLVGETFDAVKGEAPEWLDDQFFRVEGVKTIAIDSGKAADDWKLERDDESADFTLVDAKKDEELDSARTSSMKNAFSSPQFEDVLVGKKAEENQPGLTRFTITTFDGFTYEIAVGEKNDLNELPLSLEVSGEFPEKREEGEEESDEEKERLDKEFADDLAAKKDKLAAEKKLEGKVFLVRSYLVDSINKKRSEILVSEEDEKNGGQGGNPPGAPQGGLPQGLPPGVNLPGTGQ